MIRVLVVDDHPIVRQGLVAVLDDEADFEVVGRGRLGRGGAGAGRATAAGRGAARPGAARHERRRGDPPPARRPARRTRVLVFTAYDTDERVLGAVRAGAAGYLLKGATVDEIARGDPRRRERRLGAGAAGRGPADGRRAGRRAGPAR